MYHLRYVFASKRVDGEGGMPLVCVSGAELAVVVATKYVEYTVRANKDGMVATRRHPTDALPLSTLDEVRAEHPLRDVTEPQLTVVVATEPQDVPSGDEDYGVVVPATQLLHFGSFKRSFYNYKVLLILAWFHSELAVVVLTTSLYPDLQGADHGMILAACEARDSLSSQRVNDGW